MKQLLYILIASILLGNGTVLAQTPPESISAKSAIVIDATTGAVLLGKEEDTQRSMASTTKIMTTLLLLEHLPPEQEITVTKEMVTVEGSSMGLLPGDTVTVEGLCYGMMLCSGNDAANTAAIVTAGSLSAFSDMMNQKAALIGMTNTHFVTPSGLDDETHYSTAYDMALLTAYALKNPTFAKIAACRQAKVSYGNPPYSRTLTNHNQLLDSYEGCVGVKTGFTKKSGRCLVSAATRQGATLICVTLSAPDDWNDHKQLLDYGFSCLTPVTLAGGRLSLPVVGGDAPCITVDYQPLTLSVPAELKEQITTGFQGAQFLYAPLTETQVVGYRVALFQDRVIASVPLYAGRSVSATPYTPSISAKWWQNFLNLLP